MEQKNSLKIIMITLGTLFVLLFSVIVLAPSLNDLFAVEIKNAEETELPQLPLPAKPEAVTLTAHYQMEADSKKISGIYIEVLREGDDVRRRGVDQDGYENLAGRDGRGV